MTERRTAGSSLPRFLRRHKHAEEAIAEGVGINVAWRLIAAALAAGTASAAITLTATRTPTVNHPAFPLSARGAAFITRNEGVRYSPYNDPFNCTVGVGHLIHMGPCSSADYARWRISPATATALLMRDASSATVCVHASVTRRIDVAQDDALIDFAFNVGCGALERSSALADVNRGDDAHLHAALDLWSYANGVLLPGLRARRDAEARLFLTGDYGAGIGRYVPPKAKPLTPAQRRALARRVAEAKLRARSGYWAWLTWRLGEGDWKPYGASNARVRPHVPRQVTASWWRRERAFLRARTKGAAS